MEEIKRLYTIVLYCIVLYW